MDIKKIEKDLKTTLSPNRYKHSLLVAKKAKELAKIYHIDENKAYLTGLIHDIAKELSEEENKKWITIGNLSNDLEKKENKNIKHADIGAVIAKEKYKLDNDICNAIKYHTIGNKNMNTLAKIIYISDKIGREKVPTNLIPVIDLAKEDLDQALLYCLQQQKNKLKEKNIEMHKDTKELLQRLLQKKNS